MKNLIERITHIRKENKAAQEKKDNATFTVQGWRDQDIRLPIVRIAEEYLMYRIENTRTFRQQLAYIAQNNLPKDFFENKESEEVQEAQGEILLDMINAKGSAFLYDLTDRGQKEPAIITIEGYIVNGNRRTAALRHIGEKYVNCVVLPETTSDDDIYSLEQELQMAVDFREPYHWVNELRNISIGLNEKGINKERMAKRLRLKVSDLEARERAKELIDQYLDWLGLSGRYDYEKIDQAEEIFRQLEKGVKRIKNEQRKQELIYAIFHLLEHPPEEGRLYTHVTGTIRNWDEVYEKVATEVSSIDEPIADTSDKMIGERSGEDDDLIDEILLVEDDENAPDVEIFSTTEPSKDVSQMIYNASEDVKASQREKNKTEQLFNGVSKALRELQSIQVAKDSSNLEATKLKLDQLIKRANELITKINEQL